MRFIISAFIGVLRRLKEKILQQRYQARINDLVARGLVLGKNVTIDDTAYIDSGYPYLIRIGDNSSIAGGVRLLAHDATPFKFTGGHARLGKIEIKDNCFISERTIVLPGVTIGPNVLVAAGSVVNRDIPPNSCVAGVPARVYAKFDAFVERHQGQIAEREVFAYADLNPQVDESLRNKVRESVQDGDAYVKGFTGKYPHTWNNE
jgi:maltose O-acetyltransferase